MNWALATHAPGICKQHFFASIQSAPCSTLRCNMAMMACARTKIPTRCACRAHCKNATYCYKCCCWHGWHHRSHNHRSSSKQQTGSRHPRLCHVRCHERFAEQTNRIRKRKARPIGQAVNGHFHMHGRATAACCVVLTARPHLPL